jgi:hypothetical protein
MVKISMMPLRGLPFGVRLNARLGAADGWPHRAKNEHDALCGQPLDVASTEVLGHMLRPVYLYCDLACS